MYSELLTYAQAFLSRVKQRFPLRGESERVGRSCVRPPVHRPLPCRAAPTKAEVEFFPVLVFLPRTKETGGQAVIAAPSSSHIYPKPLAAVRHYRYLG